MLMGVLHVGWPGTHGRRYHCLQMGLLLWELLTVDLGVAMHHSFANEM